MYTASGYGGPVGVLAIDTGSLSVITTVSINTVFGLAITPDGKYLYASAFGSPTGVDVAVIDTSTNAVVTTIPLSATSLGASVQISPDGSMVWVSESSFITVIQTATNQVSGTISLPGGLAPYSAVFAPDGRQAYVSAWSEPVVEVVDVVTMTAVAEIDPLSSSAEMAVSPDGTVLLIPNSGTETRATAVAESTGDALASIPVGDSGNPSVVQYPFGGVALSPDGTRAYVTNFWSGNLSVIDTASKTVITNVPLGSSSQLGPTGVVVAPDGSKVYVMFATSRVTVIDTATFAATSISLPQIPSSIAISPHGQRLYVATAYYTDTATLKGYIVAIDTTTNQVVDEARIWNPGGLTVSPDGAYLYLMCGETAYFCTFSTTSNTITKRLLLRSGLMAGPAATGTAITPNGTRVFLDSGFEPMAILGNHVVEVDVVHNKVVRSIAVGRQPGPMAITPDASELWVCDYSSTSVSVIDVRNGTVTRTIPIGNQTYAITFGPR